MNPNTTTGLCVVSDTIERISTARQRKAEDLKSKSEKKGINQLKSAAKNIERNELTKEFLEKVRTEPFTDSWTKLKNVNLEAAYHKLCKPVKPAPSTKPALILILSS